jgi:hypothetical protein
MLKMGHFCFWYIFFIFISRALSSTLLCATPSSYLTFSADSDLTDVKTADGNIQTIFLYQPNNQGGTGFSNLFVHDGDFQSFFESYFD